MDVDLAQLANRFEDEIIKPFIAELPPDIVASVNRIPHGEPVPYEFVVTLWLHHPNRTAGYTIHFSMSQVFNYHDGLWADVLRPILVKGLFLLQRKGSANGSVDNQGINRGSNPQAEA